MRKDLLYVISKENHSEENLREILAKHTEIQFVSLVGIDLAGNDTDEKIPVKLFLDDVKGFLTGGVQTDGSSVALPGIASLNNAKVDMIADLDVNWYVDYNFEHLDVETNKPVGTLRIPCFLIHEGIAVDSRNVLKRATDYVKSHLLDLLRANPEYLTPYGITVDDIESVSCTSATELEFWVKTPNDQAKLEELSTAQVLQEQYWTRTKGAVRTALEQSLLLMDLYGIDAEMGHKEVGGVKGQLNADGSLTHIMEQLEIDWKYADAMQTADNELLVRIIVREIFRINGLEVTFLAKPIPGVAGSGEHTHVSIIVKTKDGKRINLFAPTISHFLSVFGYASVMGVLKNYEVINPLVTATTDSLRRLKPGFEAPVCIVTSLGHEFDIPSRNRTILIGAIRDLENPMGTRFELRAPNPHSNTYLVIAALYMAMFDGIDYALTNKRTEDQLLAELSKKEGEEAVYLEKDREYRSEEDVFEDYTDEQRDRLFGKAPATVYENLLGFTKYPEKLEALKKGDVFTDKIINSFTLTVVKRWITEVNNRIIPNYAQVVKESKALHCPEKAYDLDLTRWAKIDDLRKYILKDTTSTKSLFSKIKEATEETNYNTVSDLQLELDKKVEELTKLYAEYSKNILDF